MPRLTQWDAVESEARGASAAFSFECALDRWQLGYAQYEIQRGENQRARALGIGRCTLFHHTAARVELPVCTFPPAGIGLDELLDDLRTRYAVERVLEIVGEAAGRVSRETRDTHPQTPWTGIIAFRIVLARAQAENRIVLTQGTDFGELAFGSSRQSGYGIILFRMGGSGTLVYQRMSLISFLGIKKLL